MEEENDYLWKLLTANTANTDRLNQVVIDEFIAFEDIRARVKTIIENQKSIMADYKLFERRKTIIEQMVQLPNASVGKTYQSKLDFIQLGWDDIIDFELHGLKEIGLAFDEISEIISGDPIESGDFKITMKFRLDGELENAEWNVRTFNLFVNADPKSMWKNIPSSNEDPFWKSDAVFEQAQLGERTIVVASTRGRSHANVGSARDDDYSFHHIENTGWSIIAVSDGAGSSKFSRKGSSMACYEVVDYFKKNLTPEVSESFDVMIGQYRMESLQKEHEMEKINISEQIDSNSTSQDTAELNDIELNLEDLGISNAPETEAIVPEISQEMRIQKRISQFIYNNLGNCAHHVHNHLKTFAHENNMELKDLHSTLIFTLSKKYDFGHVILSFGVGDCPIGLLDKDLTSVQLMNWLDVGEFGGGTRFITMPEIFTSDRFVTRFGFRLVDEFSYLILMTDGIYDAKFVVEANLEKVEKWQEFIEDLKGNNEDNAQVEFNKSNPEMAQQLSNWLDFWSPGNHDDRTLAILF